MKKKTPKPITDAGRLLALSKGQSVEVKPGVVFVPNPFVGDERIAPGLRPLEPEVAWTPPTKKEASSIRRRLHGAQQGRAVRVKEEEREQLARTVECRRCDAEIGEPCRHTTTKVELPRAHNLRVIDAGGSSILPAGTNAPDIGSAVTDVKRAAGEGVVDGVRALVMDPSLKEAARGFFAGLVAEAARSLVAPATPVAATFKTEVDVRDKCDECGAHLLFYVKAPNAERPTRFEGVHAKDCPTLLQEKK